MKEVAFKKYHKNLFHTVIYLKIPFYLYQPTFGRDEFFSFFFQNTVSLFPKRLNTKKKQKTASNVLLRSTNIANKVYDVQTIQTKFARFRQKSSGYYVGPPKISTNRRAWCYGYIFSELEEYVHNLQSEAEDGDKRSQIDCYGFGKLIFYRLSEYTNVLPVQLGGTVITLNAIRVNGKQSKPFHVGVGLRQGCVLSPLLFIVYMNWIDKCSQADECATIGNCNISRLLFVDDLVLLSSTESGLQRALNSFADACNTAGMKISTAKTEVLHVSRNPDQ